MCGFAQALSTPQAKDALLFTMGMGSVLSKGKVGFPPQGFNFTPENKQQLQNESNELNNLFPMSDPLGQGQPLSQPQQMGTQGETYIQRATPKFNFRSSPFMLQTQPDQETGDSGLNLG